MFETAVDFASTILGAYVLPVKVLGVLIFLGNILVMNLGTYSSSKKPGCDVYRLLHERIRNTPAERLWRHGPTTGGFRALHFCSGVLLFFGSLATRLWGFVILNFFGALFAAVPAGKIRKLLPAFLERSIGFLTGTRTGRSLLLLAPPCGLILYTALTGGTSAPAWANGIQLIGCHLLLVWYFALFAGYWSKELPLTLWVFFVACSLLALGAALSGPPGYPFVVLESGAALMEAFFLLQERQHRIELTR